MSIADQIANTLDMPSAQALSALLAIWRDHPFPELGDLIEHVGAQVSTVSLAQNTQRATAARFLEVAATPDDAGLGAMLEVFPVGGRRAGMAQLEALSHWPRDPRLAAHLLSLFDDPPYRSRPTLPFWQQLLDTLATIADPRSGPRLTDALTRIEESFAPAMQEPMRREIAARLPLAHAVHTPDDVATAIANVSAARSGSAPPNAQSAAALLAAVFAHPDDDDLRLVYGDACIAAGDPRGELIAIGRDRARGRRLSPDARQREKALLRDHRSDWLGDLERVLLSSSIKFRLGFLDAATLKPKHEAHVQPLIGDERWSTLRHLEVRAVADYQHAAAAAAAQSVEELVAHETMRGLRRLTGDLSRSLALELCEGARERRLQTLQATLWDDRDGGLRAALSSASRLPELRELICAHAPQDSPSEYDWLLDGPLASRLSRVELRIGLATLADWIGVFRRHTFDTLCIADTWAHDRVELSRKSGSTELRATFRWPGMQVGGRSIVLGVANVLADLRPGSIHRVEVSWTRSYPATPAQRTALEAALRHLAPEHVKLPKRLPS